MYLRAGAGWRGRVEAARAAQRSGKTNVDTRTVKSDGIADDEVEYVESPVPLQCCEWTPPMHQYSSWEPESSGRISEYV